MSSSTNRPRTRSAHPRTESDESTLQQTLNDQPGPSEAQDPFAGATRDDRASDKSDEEAVENDDLYRATTPSSGRAPPSESQNGPPEANTEQRLEEMRKWLKSAQASEELRLLREIRAKYEAGDTAAVHSAQLTPNGTQIVQPKPSSTLPRPEAPKVFTKRNRAEYNRWERDCEGYFVRVPSSFTTEVEKVNFGTMYISEPLRTLWESHCSVNITTLPVWAPTWQELKNVMLNSMGTPQERRKLAYEKLKTCRQQAGKSPTDLMDYMRPLWEELGPFVTTEIKMLEFTSALRHDIQNELERLPFTMRCTIPMIEEQANIIYRRKGPPRDQNDEKAKPKPHQRQKNQRGSEGETKPPKKAKRGKLGQFGPKSDKGPSSGTPPHTITCYKCGEPGHKVLECTNPAKPGSDPREAKSGKGKGQKD
jgi:hypothetical protein